MDNLWIIPAFILLSIFISALCFIYELKNSSDTIKQKYNSEEQYIINKLRQSLNKMNSEQKIIALTIIGELKKNKLSDISSEKQKYILIFTETF